MIQQRNEPCACGSGRKYKNCCGSWHKQQNNNLIRITVSGETSTVSICVPSFKLKQLQNEPLPGDFSYTDLVPLIGIALDDTDSNYQIDREMAEKLPMTIATYFANTNTYAQSVLFNTGNNDFHFFCGRAKDRPVGQEFGSVYITFGFSQTTTVFSANPDVKAALRDNAENITLTISMMAHRVAMLSPTSNLKKLLNGGFLVASRLKSCEEEGTWRNHSR